jgi:hypothetical protein
MKLLSDCEWVPQDFSYFSLDAKPQPQPGNWLPLS